MNSWPEQIKYFSEGSINMSKLEDAERAFKDESIMSSRHRAVYSLDYLPTCKDVVFRR